MRSPEISQEKVEVSSELGDEAPIQVSSVDKLAEVMSP